jgi:hypothetical protein
MFTRAYVAFQVYAPLSMDIWGGIQSALDGLVYNVAFSIAGIHWGLLPAFLMMGHVISRINLWLSDQAFSPLIAVNSSGMRVAFTMAFVVALFILGITYMISVFIRLDVVNFQSALVWYIAGVLFFSMGPSLYQSMNSFRNTISTLFYLSVLDGIQTNDGGTFALGSVQSADLGLAPLCDYLGPYLQHPTLDNINGLDVALSYLHADGIDIMGYYTAYGIGCPVHLRNPNNGQDVASVPTAWFYNQSYFAFDYSPHGAYWDDEDQRSQAIGRAWQAHGRMLTAWPLVLFGFFRRTEAIAQAVVNQ